MLSRDSSSNLRSRLVRAGLVVVLAILAWQIYYLSTQDQFPTNDTVEYWAAGRLNWSGSNPYDPVLLLPIQQSVGWQKSWPLMMYNPPWTLTLAMPLSVLPYGTAGALWVLILFGLILLASDWAWLFYGGRKEQRWLAWILGSLFYPSLIILRLGQIDPFILLGLIGFLHFQHKKRWFWAGAALVLVAIKPQLFHLVWLGVLFWTIDQRRWGVLWGGLGAASFAMFLPQMTNQSIIGQYLVASLDQPPSEFATPTIGTFLRLAFGLDQFWLQFLAPGLSIAWFAFYWRSHRHHWLWSEQMPILLMVSLVTSAYGWAYDQIVWIPIVMQLFVWIQCAYPRTVRNPLLWAYLGVNLLVLLTRSEFIGIFNEFWYIWTGPLFILIYVVIRRRFGEMPDLTERRRDSLSLK